MTWQAYVLLGGLAALVSAIFYLALKVLRWKDEAQSQASKHKADEIDGWESNARKKETSKSVREAVETWLRNRRN